MRLEKRKQIEKEHFNKQTKSFQESFETITISDSRDSKAINLVFRAPYTFAEKWIRQRCQNKRVLDYGCGRGGYSIFLAKNGA